MDIFKLSINTSYSILALGAESSGNFSAFNDSKVYFSKDFGDLLEDMNFNEYKKEVNEFIKKNKFRPDVILCDLHPLFKTTIFAHEMAKKFKAKIIPVQHHIAHIFSAVGDRSISQPKTYNLKPKTYLGIACDGTGLGFDEKIWGGEMFKIKKSKIKNQNDNIKLQIERIAKLEDQILIGGEMAIKEPARMLISILGKFLPKNEVFFHISKYYSENEFELLWNQYQQKFNCLETSSTGRILDAVSIMLGFIGNKRGYKHEAIDLLEKNSAKPYALKPKLEITNYQLLITKKNSNSSPPNSMQKTNEMLILNTTYLFKYLIKNLHKDKKCLAATAQLYIAQGLLAISNQQLVTSKEKNKSKNQLRITDYELREVYFAGGMANNKIISSYLEPKGFYISKKIPRGDAGLSFGQLFYFILANPRD